MNQDALVNSNTLDDPIDDEIAEYLSLTNPKSFFLFAGAGSGKTRSLIHALGRIKERYGRQLKLNGQKVGVITYTNAARDEIRRRLEFDTAFHVSTIHSFAWSLIAGFTKDIKNWLETSLKSEIQELEKKQEKGRAGQASIDRARKIELKTKRLTTLPEIKKFIYNPTGDNVERDSLSHSEVIKICSGFLTHKTTMQKLLVTSFPLLLVDESQDTNKHFMDALFEVQRHNSDCFALGLLGDMMQRIYSDGKDKLGQNLPSNWASPAKQMNHRSASRLVELINKIRANVDGQEQTPRNDRGEGLVRLFILPNDTENKKDAETTIRKSMANATNDHGWYGAPQDVKTLILEHHMAAGRMGFELMFEPLYKVDKFRTGLLDGSMPELRLFANLILPLVTALKEENKHAVASIIREKSPLLDKRVLKRISKDQTIQIKKANKAVNELYSLWENNNDPSFLEVLQTVTQSGLFDIPNRFIPIIQRSVEEHKAAKVEDDEDDQDIKLSALSEFLSTPFSQIQPYTDYINQSSPFDTHQGVKGREFPRVMVIIDDTEARGFMFKYDKLFGVAPLTGRDKQNEREGNDTAQLRARRLFYVTCSRAEESLAIVAYSEDPQAVYNTALQESWFKKEEMQIGF
ncbi:UvrD-helicase domain-containing protein [Kiloniella sp.]|uniref:UvrD-helicase domain-containing protein n=1 Tax=Kiloniella sp. TaxID=1938587 RepID=UPI003A90A5EB